MKSFAVAVLMIVIPGCAAMQAQQRLDTAKSQAAKMDDVTDSRYFKAIEQCTGAGAMFLRVIREGSDKLTEYADVFEYINAAGKTIVYMRSRATSLETALIEHGDILFPVNIRLKEVAKLFGGCMLMPGRRSKDDSITLGWVPKTNESESALEKAYDEAISPDSPLRPLLNTWKAYSTTVNARMDKGELTMLQYIRLVNAGREYYAAQTSRIWQALRNNVETAKLQDQTTLQAVAVGFSAVATAAMVVNTYENYRIANATDRLATAAQLQAIQNTAPIQCTVTHGSYRYPDYIRCQ